MALPDFPIPKLDVTLQEVSRVLQLTLSPELYEEFKSTLHQQREVLDEIHKKTATMAEGQENWVTQQFKKGLLSCADPLPTSTALPVVLLPCKLKGCTQLMRSAALLWAAAKLYSEPLLLEGNAPMEHTQQSEIFAACRIPGKTRDEIKVYPDSLHAVVTCAGGVFPVDILWRPATDGPVSAKSFTDIYNQLAQVLDQPKAEKENDPSIICSLSALERKSWAGLREGILNQRGEAATSLGVMESAVVTLCLEDINAPAELADVLNAVRLGGARKGSPCLRYYDKVMNFVVFKDCTAGMVFEHSAVDGMVVTLMTERLYQLSESIDLNLPSDEENGTQSAAENSGSFPCPGSLKFPLEEISTPQKNDELTASHPVLTFDLSSYPDVFSTLRGQRGLFDAWVSFTLQLSLQQTFGESANSHILVTPTHMRHFKHGRCDPTYSVTSHSRNLVNVLASRIRADKTINYTTDLLEFFHVAFQEHKNLIRHTKTGQGVGPHLAALRRSMSPDNPLKRFLDPFGCPSVYLTGIDLMESVECGVGNVYSQDQLAVTYLGKRDKVRIMLNGKGSFASELTKLKENLKTNLKMMMLLAVRYAIASQMEALECIFQQNVTKQLKSDDQRNGKSSSENPSFTLVIHGGAGEDMMLNSKVTGMIEFALNTALALGSEVLHQGGQSLDAVQRSVEALENCFLFNAGKGSVFNKDGANEMEAAIVDGTTKMAGSVACVKSTKNPIKAARFVMEKSPHVLIVGEGAEEYLQSLDEKEKPVGPEYFHTDVRHEQLLLKLKDGNSSRGRHPQTVGAVAVDQRNHLAAASSTGGLVGKLKGRVGDTAVVGAGIYADEKVAIACSGDGDVFLRNSVAQKVASLFHNKGYSLREACREVMATDLCGTCAGFIAVDAKGKVVVETNAGVMFVGSVSGGVSRAEVLRPLKNFSHVIWETDELVAYLNPNPSTPGSTILTRKVHNGASSLFQLASPDFTAMLQGAKAVSNLMCMRLGVERCALVCYPIPDQPVQIKLLPLHTLESKLEPPLATEGQFHNYNIGYCTSKNGPRCDDEILSQIQAKIRNTMPNQESSLCSQELNSPLGCAAVGEMVQWKVWENEKYVAFLTPSPSTPGVTVVRPHRELLENSFKLNESDYTALILAAYEVAHFLEQAMKASSVALIFEGFESDHSHIKLIPLLLPPNGSKSPEMQPEYFESYPGFVSSVDGPLAESETLKEIHLKLTHCKPPQSWKDPLYHSTLAINSQWYCKVFQIQNTLFHSTVEYFHSSCKFAYALTPLTTDTISSPMGLGSDSEPVSVSLLGQDVYLADSMQFVLEYFLRFQEELPGTYYISPSFRGEDPDSTHLNQFYHVECELLGDMDSAILIAERYLAHLTKSMLKKHSDIILSTAGTLTHAESMISSLEKNSGLPRISLDQALPMMPSSDCVEWVKDGQPEFGRKLTRKGERVLIERYGGSVWLTEMDHLGVPFYQAYVEGTERHKAKAADLLLGLGETIGLGERHSNPHMVQEALRHHAVPEESYKWYIDMRHIKPLHTSGWGMGTERYLCWLLQHDDVRDLHIIPRLKGKKYMP